MKIYEIRKNIANKSTSEIKRLKNQMDELDNAGVPIDLERYFVLIDEINRRDE